MQAEQQSSVSSLDRVSQGLECVLYRNREKAQIQDLQNILDSYGTIDRNFTKEFETIYKWTNVFNELDVLQDKKLVI